jgi:hypothetical protein
LALKIVDCGDPEHAGHGNFVFGGAALLPKGEDLLFEQRFSIFIRKPDVAGHF